MYWALIIACAVTGAPEPAAMTAADQLVSTLRSAEEMTFRVSIVESFMEEDLQNDRARRAAAALSNADVYVEMTPEMICAQVDLPSNGFVTILSDGRTVSIVQPDGKSSSFDVDGDGWWDHLDAIGIPPCVVTSYLETWLGSSSWFTDWLEDSLANSVAEQASSQLAFYRDDGQLQQLFDIAQISPSAAMLSMWATINEADIGGQDFLVKRTRVFREVEIRLPCSTIGETKCVLRKEVKMANTR